MLLDIAATKESRRKTLGRERWLNAQGDSESLLSKRASTHCTGTGTGDTRAIR
jgi:hypothetical protein